MDYVLVTLYNPNTGRLIAVRDYRKTSIEAILSDYCSLTEFARSFANPACMAVREDGTIILERSFNTKLIEKVEFFEVFKQVREQKT